MVRMIQPSGSRSTEGRVFDVAELPHTRVREGYDVPPRSLFLSVDKSAGAVLVQLTVGEGDGGAQTIRLFHVDGRGAWLSVAGWRYAKLEIVNIPAGFVLRFCWLTEPRASTSYAPAVRFWQTIPVGATTAPIPNGAITVTPDRNEAGASWRQTDGGGTFNIPASLVAGTETDVRGSQLVFGAALGVALTLCWALEVL